MTSDDLHLANHPAMPALGDLIEQRYEVLRIIAEGGSSVVYEVRDHLAGGRLAIKVLSPRKSNDPSFAQRFRDEASLLRRLAHPNTVRVLDVGETDQGCLYLVQELLEGEDLGARIAREGALDEAVAVHLLGQVLKALDEAHEAGIVHRDLKPANLMICQFEGDEDFVKVLDFGIAKQLDEGRISPGTSPNEVLFTPQYAAPELLNGGAIRPASDVYALGLIGLEMLTGEQVVTGSTIWQIIAEQISPSALQPPSGIEELSIAPVMRRAIAKRPEDRFRDAGAMLRALEAAKAVGAPLRSLAAPPVPAVTAPAGAPGLRAAGSDEIPTWLDSDVVLDVPASGELPEPRATDTSSTTAPQWATIPVPAQGSVSRDDDVRSSAPGSADDVGPAGREPPAAAPRTPSGGRLVIIAALALVAAGAWLAVSRLGQQGGGAAEGSGAGAAEPAVDEAPLRERCRDGDWAICVALASGEVAVPGRGIGISEGHELLALACDTGGYEPACRELGHLAAQGYGVPLASARQAWGHLCQAGDREACWRAGYAWLQDDGTEPDAARARELLQMACDAGESMGCAGLASIWERGWGVPADLPRAAELYEVACDDAVAEACSRLGELWYRGIEGEPRLEEARRVFGNACAGGVREACANLAMMMQRGLGGELDLAAAAGLYETACDQGVVGACAGLANLYERGDGVESDAGRARELYRRACDGGEGIACFRLAALVEATDAEAAAELRRLACERDYQSACE